MSNTVEEWKKLPYDNLQHYEISTLGNVRIIPRVVSTHIVNHGKDMIVLAKRKGRDVKVQYEDGRPTIIAIGSDGVRKKFSLPLLMLKTFKLDECQGNPDNYIAAYLDNDTHNNNIDNLVWISKSSVMLSIANTTKGENKSLAKYKNVVIKVNGQILGYFSNTTEGAELFNSYGINTSASALARTLKDGKKFYYIFDLEQVSDKEYLSVCKGYPQVNLKMIYDLVVEDRKYSRKLNTKVKKVTKKQIVYKEKIVYKPKIEKQIVYKEKIVYKPKIVYKEKKSEKSKEEKKVLVNDSTANGKETQSKVLKTAKTKISKLNGIDDAEFYREQEQLKKDRFKEEMLRLLNNS